MLSILLSLKNESVLKNFLNNIEKNEDYYACAFMSMVEVLFGEKKCILYENGGFVAKNFNDITGLVYSTADKGIVLGKNWDYRNDSVCEVFTRDINHDVAWIKMDPKISLANKTTEAKRSFDFIKQEIGRKSKKYSIIDCRPGVTETCKIADIESLYDFITNSSDNAFEESGSKYQMTSVIIALDNHYFNYSFDKNRELWFCYDGSSKRNVGKSLKKEKVYLKDRDIRGAICLFEKLE